MVLFPRKPRQLLGLDPKANYSLYPVLGLSHMPSFPHSEDGGEDLLAPQTPVPGGAVCGYTGGSQPRPFGPQQQLVLSLAPGDLGPPTATGPGVCRLHTVRLAGCETDPLCLCNTFIPKVSCCVFSRGFPQRHCTPQRGSGSCLRSPEGDRGAPPQSPDAGHGWNETQELQTPGIPGVSGAGLTPIILGGERERKPGPRGQEGWGEGCCSDPH